METVLKSRAYVGPAERQNYLTEVSHTLQLYTFKVCVSVVVLHTAALHIQSVCFCCCCWTLQLYTFKVCVSVVVVVGHTAALHIQSVCFCCCCCCCWTHCSSKHSVSTVVVKGKDKMNNLSKEMISDFYLTGLVTVQIRSSIICQLVLPIKDLFSLTGSEWRCVVFVLKSSRVPL